MRTITVTRQNLTNLDAGNNTFEFQFNGSADLTNCEIALSSMFFYFFLYNLSATLGNNTFKNSTICIVGRRRWYLPY